MKRWLISCGLMLYLLLPSVQAVAIDDLLDPHEAFAFTLTSPDADTLVIEWDIAEGYYLYRERLGFESTTAGIRLGEPHFPSGKLTEDEFFGEMEIYRDQVAIEIPLLREADAPNRLELKIDSQGCADIGVCYPPQTQTAALELPPPPKADLAAPAAKDPLGLLQPPQDELLDPEQAFIPSLTVTDPTTVLATWTIAEGYYLYRDKLTLSLMDAEGVNIKDVEIPPGEPKEDEFFGLQQVFYDQAVATAHLQRQRPEPHDITVEVGYQGCAEIGVCYPPMTQTIPVSLPMLDAQATAMAQPEDTPAPPTADDEIPAEAEPPMVAEQDLISRMLVEQRFWAMPAFFGFGLLLAFTPCVFPMIPILSSIIAGHGASLSQRRGFMLSLVYVLAMAITYTIAGVLAAMLGQNIQALFQNPWVLGSFSVVFVLLALSMFGFYELQLPASWQSKLTEVSNRQGGGSYTGVAIMGLLSALIVGPCVAPPLIGVLAVIAATGDTVLGGSALFIMSLGMGAPLLAIGASAGQLLPRAGHWMDTVKAVFGVLLLAVAIWMLERILPATISMLLWAVLLIISATYMGVFQPLKADMPGWRTLVKGFGVVLLIYGILLLVGVAAGGRDTLQPLRGVGLLATGTPTQAQEPDFKPVKSLADLERELNQAQATGQPVMLDFYADWCVACKEMERYTFTDPGVQAAWAHAVLLKADVTANDADDQALMRHFGIFGPPAYLFFGPDGSERRDFRVVGFVPADRFKNHLDQALSL